MNQLYDFFSSFNSNIRKKERQRKKIKTTWKKQTKQK